MEDVVLRRDRLRKLRQMRDEASLNMMLNPGGPRDVDEDLQELGIVFQWERLVDRLAVRFPLGCGDGSLVARAWPDGSYWLCDVGAEPKRRRMS